jgi:hypothetical protein
MALTTGVAGVIFRPLSADGRKRYRRSVAAHSYPYKAKGMRRKDETDFSAVLRALTQPQRNWLADVIALAYGAGHPWHVRLLAGPGAVP